MKAIHKYLVPFQEVATVQMREGAHIIRVDDVEGLIYVWAVVDTDADIVPRTLYLFKTGAQMPDDILTAYRYLGCGGIFVQMELMMYIYEKVA